MRWTSNEKVKKKKRVKLSEKKKQGSGWLLEKREMASATPEEFNGRRED